jgi:hypothetical protein
MLYNDWDYVGDETGVGQSYKDLATSVDIGGQVRCQQDVGVRVQCVYGSRATRLGRRAVMCERAH